MECKNGISDPDLKEQLFQGNSTVSVTEMCPKSTTICKHRENHYKLMTAMTEVSKNDFQKLYKCWQSVALPTGYFKGTAA
jgi:hypothetical protein